MFKPEISLLYYFKKVISKEIKSSFSCGVILLKIIVIFKIIQRRFSLKLTKLFKCCGNLNEKIDVILHLLCKRTLYINYMNK